MVRLWDLFTSFFRIGLFTLGGGWAMLPLIETEVVRYRRWLESEAFLDLLAVAQAAPGAVAVNTAVAVGYRLRRGWGALVALLGVVLPSFVTIILVAVYLVRWEKVALLQRIMAGVRPAVGALIAVAALRLGGGTLKTRVDKLVAIVGLGALLAGVHPIAVLVVAGAWGIWRKGVVRRGRA